MTLTFELDIDMVKMNQPAGYLGHRSLSSKAIVWTHQQTDTHTHSRPIALPVPLTLWSATTSDVRHIARYVTKVTYRSGIVIR